ncbi:MAG: acyl-CoA dehydrogenase family protein [Dehalococcoidia bacterium]|nr:acyl-CoA dehydrogenase family protein [Dehalococcoidia bacterium]
MEGKAMRRGGSFLVEEIPAREVFTPEDFGEEHKMLIKTTEDFVKNEVAPHIEQLEKKDFELTRRFMRQAGALGLLGADIPEEYGGSGLGATASLLVGEHFVGGGSLSVVVNCHTGIGSMPLVFFGSKAQKAKYLPGLASGEKIGAYALTEPGAGTDALSMQATATLTPDGKYYKLNGTKQFITNGGFADIITTYAKVGGEKITAFVLERGFPGVSTGPEEKKMGLDGSSTVSVILEDAQVPVENVPFEIGKGHTVAFNVLDLGRFKLAAASVGVAKLALEHSVKYAKERIQFGKPICQFGMIKHKIAEMAIRTYVGESMVYRTAGLIEAVLETVDRTADDSGRQSGKAIAEYAIECSINKVFCSEMLDYVADEAVQIYGGYGYIKEYPVERIYRDNRIFRIFEGTNEINRVVVVGFLMRKALKNEIPLLAAIEKLKSELPGMKPVSPHVHGGPLAYEHALIERAKKALLMVAGAAVGKYGEAVSEEQEILGRISDIAAEVFAMESGLLRALKCREVAGEEASRLKVDMVRVYVAEAMCRVYEYAAGALAAVYTGKELTEQVSALHNMTQVSPINVIALRRGIADRVIAAEKYIC